MTAAYFERLSYSQFRATEHTGGAWSEQEQHIAPMIGLIVHELMRTHPAPSLLLSRLSVDILGVLAIDDFDLTVRVVRPGRTIQLLEARVVQGGRDAVAARAWRSIASDTSDVSGGAGAAMPPPESFPVLPMSDLWPGGFIATVQARQDPDSVPGRGRSWIRPTLPLLPDEEISTLARWMGVTDTANGLSAREGPRSWLFPNLDLTAHLYREPAGDWTGMDTTVTFGATGVGLTDTALHDIAGPVGRLTQILTLRRR